MLDIFHLEFLYSTLRIATPLLLAATGGLIAWRAGVINLGLEGYMLLGAFASCVGIVVTNSVLFGLLAAMLFVAAVALAMSYALVIRGADQIVTGIMFNIFALGLTTYLANLLQTAWGTGSLSSATAFNAALGNLRELPILGWLFTAFDPFLVFAAIAIGAFVYVLKMTPAGTSIKAVGEQARAADAAGVNVNRLRVLCYVVGSVVAGIGGAFLSVSYLGMFTANMTSGQGYIAIAIIIMGRWKPVLVVLSALVFGVAFALQVRWQMSSGLPVEVVLALPYLLTLLIVAIVGRGSGPAEEGRRYIRSSR